MGKSEVLKATNGRVSMPGRTDKEFLSSEDIFFLLAAISPHRSNAVYNTLFEKLSELLILKNQLKNPH